MIAPSAWGYCDVMVMIDGFMFGLVWVSRYPQVNLRGHDRCTWDGYTCMNEMKDEIAFLRLDGWSVSFYYVSTMITQSNDLFTVRIACYSQTKDFKGIYRALTTMN
jgi:hypothetical protein